MNVLAVIGPTALYLMFSWLLSAIIASDLSDRKGYGEKPGLATGILLSAVGALAWLVMLPRRGSLWSRFVHPLDLAMALGAVVLIGSLFAPWYSGGGNFFDKLAFYELLVPFGAAAAYAQLHSRASGRAPDSVARVALIAATLALVATVVAAVTPPDGVSLEWGAYVSLLTAVVTTGAAAAASRVDREALGTERPVASRQVGAQPS
jgi:hypothetical protein